MPTDTQQTGSNSSNFWAGLIKAGVSMYGSYKDKKKAQDKTDYLNSVLQSQRDYEQQKIQTYQHSPAAEMSPLIMKMLVETYAPLFKKRGVNFPLESFLGAISGHPGDTGPGRGNNVIGGSGERQSLADLAGVGNTMLTADGTRIPRQMRSDGSFGNANTAPGGDVQYVMGKVNPEIAGYSKGTWHDSERTGEYSSAFEPGAFGVSAGEVGGQREPTREMGNTTTQTERGYTNTPQSWSPWNTNNQGVGVSQDSPNLYGDLATGGQVSMDAADIPDFNLSGLMGAFGGGNEEQAGPPGNLAPGSGGIFNPNSALMKILGFIPGYGSILKGGANELYKHGIGDAQPDNAGWRYANR